MEREPENIPTNHEILRDFMLHMQLANRSENTLETYSRLLNRFLYHTSIPIHEMTSDYVWEWLKEHGRDKKETTVATWISILSSFFTFCDNEGYIEGIPMKSRWRPRLPKPLPRYIGKEELAIIKIQSEAGNLRNQVLFEFLSSSGCRITEALMLDKNDINVEERTARVKGKGSKLRTVHFSHRCAILLEEHLKRLPEMSDGIFLNQHKRKLTRQGAHKILREMGETAQLVGAFGPHRLRHTFATSLLAKGAELSFISEELGHSQLSTTRVYARLLDEKLVTMYRKYMG
ncbi:tyrosine-type recombinase/integrase [Pontibacillus yanchengensis]|nr:tyrosine-type recombinase/integrase [Pontibacillus yanchengensis]